MKQKKSARKNHVRAKVGTQQYLLSLGLVLKEKLEQGGRERGVGEQRRHRGGRTEEACT